MQTNGPLLLSLILLFSTFNGFASVFAIPDTVRLELMHRHSPHAIGRVLFEQRPSTLERIKDLLRSDGVRRSMISNRLTSGGRRNVWATGASAQLPLRSGADYRTGQYFVTMKVGTPAQKFLLIADTGSDLTWINCDYRCGLDCARKRRSRRRRRFFRADISTSFRTVPCMSKMCKVELANLFSLARCPTPLIPCAFDYRYLDGSAASGIFANETVTLGLANGKKRRLHNVLVGCSQSVRGPSFSVADGVMGLGFSDHSFATKAARSFGGKFSYCLVDHLSSKNVSSFLTFGRAATKTPRSCMQFTQLALGVLSPFYAVHVAGISLDGVLLRIPVEVWDANGAGGTILDSGSSLTSLAQPAFQPIMAALKLSLRAFQKLELDVGPLEYCFNSTGFVDSMVPKLRFHFVDGARFEPPVKSYVIDVADGVKCLGFMSTSWPGFSVIGNIMQQNHLWEFDLGRGRLGFAPSACT
ncbi:aspartic proteinase NANA, chloroplast-like [Malania oleifera]|uniref:aspartic proteinase NANA, chloroplast-like n=1 Tax=Malania oleifera TaxID=397392 RepID=UPI0025AE7690|nr:aspartic proteinase NANA, chloroplast-like [Malania oleifera]